MSKETGPPKNAELTAQLRWFLRHADETTHEISRQIGVHSSSLYRFLSAERGLSDDAIDKLAKHLRLRLIRDKK